jgi:hypothetical protein
MNRTRLVIKQQQLRKWFPEEDFFAVPAAVLPAGITDESTRRVLSELALPESFLDLVELETNMTAQVRTVDEVYQKYDEQPPRGASGLFFLGFADEAFLCLDGRTGALSQVHEKIGIRPFASSLETFLHVLGFISYQVERYQRSRSTNSKKFADRLTRRSLKHLKQIDPAAFATAAPAWRDLLDHTCATVA